jgi:hypothetical protein
MVPRDTHYRLVRSREEWDRVHRFIAEHLGQDTGRLRLPTVIAERQDRWLGVLGTHDRADAIVAGPLVVDPAGPWPGMTVIRLIEAYEVALRRCGVSAYVFHVDDGTDPRWARLVDLLRIAPWGGPGWYERRIA